MKFLKGPLISSCMSLLIFPGTGLDRTGRPPWLVHLALGCPCSRVGQSCRQRLRGLSQTRSRAEKKTAGSVEIFQNPSCRVSSQQALVSQTGRAGDLQSGGTLSLHVCLAVSGAGPGRAAGHSSPEPAVWHFSNLLITRESRRLPGVRFELIFRSRCAVQALDRSLRFNSGFLGRSGRVDTGPALFPVLGTWRWQQTRAVEGSLPLLGPSPGVRRCRQGVMGQLAGVWECYPQS